jgi:hypothetical protein
MHIIQIAEEVNAEKTYYDNELVALTFSIANLEKFVDKLAQEPVGYVTDSGLSAVFNIGVDLDDGTPLYARIK